MQCPVCRAANDQGPQCRRCRADLSLLFALDSQHRQALARARACLAQGLWQRGLAIAEAAEYLRLDEDTRRLHAVGALLQRDYARAWTLALSPSAKGRMTWVQLP